MSSSAAVSRALRALPLRRGSKGHNWLQRHYEDKAAREAFLARIDAEPILPAPAEGHRRARAWLEFSREKQVVGRVEVELADDLLPRTAENFLRLATGDAMLGPNTTSAEAETTAAKESGDDKYSYKGTELHQIMRESWLLMGDVGHQQGRGGHSAFAERYFEDEGYFFRHAKPGILSMANAGAHMNASCFFITLKPCMHLDGRHVPFGAVTKGMDVLEDLSKDLIVKGKPTSPIFISDCGVF